MKYRLRKPDEREIKELEIALATKVTRELNLREKCGLGIARSILVVSAVAVIEDLLFEEENPEDVTMPICVWRKALVCIGASSPKLQVDLFVWRNGKLESLSA